MNNNIILIAEEDGGIDIDMFDTTLPPIEETNSEIPVLPDVEPVQKPSEGMFLLQKFSFTILITAISIVIFLIIVLIIKKIKTVPAQKVEYIPELTDEQEEYIQKSAVHKRSTSKLSTPSSIHKCILSFLDITKDR